MIVKFFTQSFFKDRAALWLTAVLTALLLVNLVVVFASLEGGFDLVPVSYSNYAVGLYERASWRALYAFPLFAACIYVMNLYISTKLHAMRSEYSYIFMGLSIVIIIFNIFVSQALIGLS